MRRLNLVFLMVLLVVTALLGGGMHLVHQVQMQRNASALLDRARRAEADQDLEKAEQSLRLYLNLRRDDGPTWTWYARVVDQQDSDRRRRERVFLIHEQALRYSAGDPKLERRCADLALELGRYSDARRHLESLNHRVARDARLQPAAGAPAELEDLLGQCERGQARYEAAERCFLQALQHDPGRVDCYDRLARLRRTDLGRIGDADGTVQEMIAKNPRSGRAYAYRWRYARELAPPADAGDIKKALELAPDDPDVLLAAAAGAEQRGDLVALRAHLEKGRDRAPKNAAFALALARLEMQAGHPERAEAVLRQAIRVNPAALLVFVLAETLIVQDKIVGKDGADGFIAVLGSHGLGETLGRFLEAEILVHRQQWSQAIAALEMARAVLRSDHQFTVRLDLMLADAYGRVGGEEQRLDALQRAAEADQGGESARIELVQTLARSGKLDQALAILLPIADRKPEWRLDLVRLLLRKTLRQPRAHRNWPEVERYLQEAERALPQAEESLVLLRLDVLAAQGRLDDARSRLNEALAREPRNLRYRLARARLVQRQGQGAAALTLIDQAEKDLGPSLDIQLARLDYWGRQGGGVAKAALARLAQARRRMPEADRPVFLDRLGAVAIRLGELNLGRRYWRELADLQKPNLGVRLGLFDLALAAGDRREAGDLVQEIRKVEGDLGASWRFAKTALLLDAVRRGASHDLEEARALAAEISHQRPGWWVGPTLEGDIAQLEGSLDQAIDCYLRALELGNVQPSFARRLVGLLNQRNRSADIDHVTQVLRDQGAALEEVTIVQALEAIRRQDFDTGIKLALHLFPADSASASDHLNLGRVYLAAGRSDQAGAHFQRAVTLGPGIPEVWLSYVQHLVQVQQVDRARAAVEQARQALPAPRAALTLAQCYLVLGDARQAEALVLKALGAGQPADPAALRLAAGLYLGQNRLDQVAHYLNQLDQVGDASPADKAWVNRTRAAVLLAHGRPADQDRALRLVEQNLADAPTGVEDLQLRATILALRPSRRQEAVPILEQLDAAHRLSGNYRFLLAQLYLGQGNDEKYRGEMSRLLGLKVKDPRHLAHFINYAIAQNQRDEARRRLAELKTIEPRGVAALELEARLLDLGKERPALRALLEARAREVPDQIGTVADLWSRYGFAREAEAAYKAFLVRNPKQPERALTLAVFLTGQDRVAEAMEILTKAWTTCRPDQVAIAALPVYDAPSAGAAQKRQVEAWVAEAIRQRPDSVLLSCKLGVLWIRQGRFDESEGLLRRILAQDPDNAEALNDLAWLLSLRDSGKAAEAVALINRAIGLQGESPSLADTRAVARIQLGQVDQAVAELLAIRKQSPANPSFALHLAWAYHAEGRSDQARSQLHEAEKLGLKPQALDPLERAVAQRLRQELFPG